MAEARKVAYVFPGQGAQAVGMGRDLYDGFSSARAVFDAADRVLGFPISRLCFEGPEDELAKTVNAQPALATVSFACLRVAEEVGVLPAPAFVAGHSLGEYTALAAAGMLDFADVVCLARERGRLMYEAGLEKPGGMLAVIGLEADVVAEVCEASGTWVANLNCPGQVVISGEKEKLERAAGLAQARGASRVVPLPVSGAFHTPLMAEAARGMARAIDGVAFREASVPLVANTSARPIVTADEVRAELLKQMTSAVQWQRSIENMIASGVSLFIEIGPRRVLSGLIKRISREATTLNIGEASDIRGASKS